MLALLPGFFVTIVLAVAMPDVLNTPAVLIFCAAVLAVLFFALGGELRLFSWMGIAKPAPPALSAMVDELAERMNVKGKVRVFVVELPQVNALAWQRNRAIGFSGALLEVMTDKEVRAVAAHELGHMLEPAWARGVRTAHLFAYLPLIPLVKYGGPFAAPIGFVLFISFFIAYVRFSHRFEQRADRAEHEAIGDPAAYAMCLTKLHQANVTPAVMPGKQTHPHLYDRLLAGGIQPDFPRPQPPSRAKLILAVLTTTFAVALLVLVMFGGIAVCLQLLGYDVRLEAREPKHDVSSE